jgi:hypothetical protein
MATLLTTTKDTFTQVNEGDSSCGEAPDDLDLVLDRTSPINYLKTVFLYDKPSRSLESLRLELEQFYRPDTDLD